MKKRQHLLTAILTFVVVLLSACGESAYEVTDAAEAKAQTEVAEEYDTEDTTELAVAAGADMAETGAEDAEGVVSGESTTDNLADKIIYSAYGELETTEFDASVQAVYDLVERYNGFIETSSITGNDLQSAAYSYFQGRIAQFTLRVPSDSYSTVTSDLNSVGNVTYLTSDATNITAQYTDVQAQLSAYETQEERLLEIMEQATTVEDMIQLESRLGEVRSEIEQLKTQLENWDRQVNYSTVSLVINEVEELTPEPAEEEPGYWEQVGQAFLNSLQWVGRAAKEGFKLLVAAIPIVLPVLIVILILVLLCRRAERRRKQKQEQQRNNQMQKDQ